MNWKDHKPAIRFLSWFLGIYLIGNLVYGLYVESAHPNPDIFTSFISSQASSVLNSIGYTVSSIRNPLGPTVLMQEAGETVLRVYEGCNGINVFIVFVGFVIAFGGRRSWILLFMGTGIIVIHIANVFRICILFWIAKQHQAYFYYVHKYLFTAAIYLVVFLLWWVWVTISLKARQPRKVA